MEDAHEPIVDAASRSHGVCWSPRGGMAKFDMVMPPRPQQPAPVAIKSPFRFTSSSKKEQPPPPTTTITTSHVRAFPKQSIAE